MHIVSAARLGFTLTPLHKKKEPHAFHYLSQRVSFWVAMLSVIAYVAGNMMGQYGWHVFWASVLGKEDDSLIVYNGTVSPIALVPDYEKWATFGGNYLEHSYDQVPKEVLVPLPKYNVKQQHENENLSSTVFSISHLGSYKNGQEDSGSHIGVDIRVPQGTPVVSVMNGIVEDVRENGGYGKVIIVRHPNVPDPNEPSKKTTIWSIYAHLSSILVTKGSVISKGERIGLSGQTGFATGPHLHFQMDNAEAPWHPYWPFSDAEAKAAGYNFTQAIDNGLFQSRARLYTVHPMLYVQANYAAPSTAVASTTVVQPTVDQPKSVNAAAERRAYRIALMKTKKEERLLARRARAVVVTKAAAPVEAPAAIIQRDTVVSATVEVPMAPSDIKLDIRHDGTFSGRGWEVIRISLVDANGNELKNAVLEGEVHMRTAFGDAEFRPAILTARDFNDGRAEVNILPRGRRTVVIQAMPQNVVSKPMVYQE